jgi:hypothetical protein
MGGPPAWGLGVGPTPLHHKNKFAMDIKKEPQDLDGFFG